MSTIEHRAIYEKSERYPADRYTSRSFHELEVDRLWGRCWQIACLASDVDEPGAYVEYSVGSETVVVIRGDDGNLRALANVCRHRGTVLRSGEGITAELRCPFHGWRYGLDGRLEEVPNEWDFADVDRERCRLPEFLVETWAGFVFVNLDREAEPLSTFLGPLSGRFDTYRLQQRCRSAAVSIVLPCNWKIALAAFPEAYHVPWTHPEAAFTTSDVGTTIELLGVHGRITIPRDQSPNNSVPLDDDEYVEEYLAAAPAALQLALQERAAGRSGIEALVAVFRADLLARGVDVDDVTDDELAVNEGYLIFPNVVAYVGLTSQGIFWRFRPDGDNSERCIVDLWLLTFPDDPASTPGNVPTQYLPEGALLSEALGSGNRLGPVFDQDLANLKGVQRAYHSRHFGGPLYGRYQEALVRNFEEALDCYLTAEQG